MTDADWIEVVLAGWRDGQRLGAVGPGPVEEQWRHARALATLLPDDATSGLDLGTGVGLPGLALVGLRPDMQWTLLDAARRRIAVVQRVVDELGWAARVDVVHARAEDHARSSRRRVDVVVARSFGRPPVVAECAAPLVRVGGRLLVTEPPLEDADRWPAAGLAQLGLSAHTRHLEPAVQELCKVEETDEARFPRRPGMADKRPLW